MFEIYSLAESYHWLLGNQRQRNRYRQSAPSPRIRNNNQIPTNHFAWTIWTKIWYHYEILPKAWWKFTTDFTGIEYITAGAIFTSMQQIYRIYFAAIRMITSNCWSSPIIKVISSTLKRPHITETWNAQEKAARPSRLGGSCNTSSRWGFCFSL